MEEKSTSVVKTFRLDNELSKKIDLLRDARNTTMQNIIKEALVQYLKEHLDEARIAIDEITRAKEKSNLKEHMYIPIQYYALYNDMTVEETNKMISRKELQSVTLGGVILVMIDISESAYKKAELLVIKHNVSKVMKEMSSLKSEVSRLKKELKSFSSYKTVN